MTKNFGKIIKMKTKSNWLIFKEKTKTIIALEK